MKLFPLALAAMLCAAGVPLLAQAPAAVPAAATPVKSPGPFQPADLPAPKIDLEGKPNAGFLTTHQQFVEIAKKGGVDLLFLGDSITAGWKAQPEIWNKAFGAYQTANFGIGGDRTQHVLYRIQNGELDGISPRAIVLMIGTNNSGPGRNEPPDTIRGIQKIVATIREKCPAAKLLLLGIFPRGDKPNPQRAQNEEVNAAISKLDDQQHVFYLDIGSKFLDAEQTLTTEIAPDLLHLSAKGYQIWADAITPKLAELMK